MSRIATGTFADASYVEAFWFELPGPARSKSNARRFSGAGAASVKERRAYASQQAFAAAVTTVARAARPRSWELGPTGRDTLARRPQVVSVVIARSNLDVTNVPKSLHDACETVVFHNDASVRAATQLTVRGTGGGGVVGFARLPADASAAEVAAALQVLTGQLLGEAAILVDGIAA